LEDLISLHAPIGNQFFKKNWGKIQNTDSAIAEEIMIRLLDHSPTIKALPIHDSFIVPYIYKDVLLETMKAVFEEKLLKECIVDQDVSVFEPPEGFDPRTPPFLSPDVSAKAGQDYYTSRIQYFIRQLQWLENETGDADTETPISIYDGKRVPDPRYWAYLNEKRQKKHPIPRMVVVPQID